MAADFADGPSAPVAGMQAGTWAVTQAGYLRGCRQQPSASELAMLIARGHLPENRSTHELVTTGESHVRFKSNPGDSPVLRAGCSFHLMAEKETLASFPSPFFRRTHRGHLPLEPLLRHARSSLALGRGLQAVPRGAQPGPAASCSPRQGQDLHPGNSRLQWPSMTEPCHRLSTRSGKKPRARRRTSETPLSSGSPAPPFLQPGSVCRAGGVPGAGGASPARPPAARGLLAFPSPGGHGPAFVSDGSIVAPDFSSNCLCQAEQPREQLKQEAAAGPKLEKRLLGAPGFREGRAQPTQRRPCCSGTS